MGEVELNAGECIITIHSHIITYGHAADAEITERIRSEIECMWNEPQAVISLQKKNFRVIFRITAECIPLLGEPDVVQNTSPHHNFFRIEEYVHGNISFVDGLGCNTGYFKLENLYEGSTTAAHEYGHTLGLDHPPVTDIRGQGVPGIMYPRGTLVDPEFQYDPSRPAGVTGGTMHPRYRRVKQEDIQALRLERLAWKNNRAVTGAFTNIYHRSHAGPVS